jgi:hypothetical protein
VTNVLDEDMKKGLLRICEAIMTMIVLAFSPSGTMLNVGGSAEGEE